MMTRVRPILTGQLFNSGAILFQRLVMMEDFFNNPDRVPDPHPANHYFYGAGGSAYYSPDIQSDTLDRNSIFQSLAFDTSNWSGTLLQEVNLTLPFGLRRIAYEGGPGLDKTGHSDDVKEATWADPRMESLVTNHHAAWRASAGDLLVYFSLTIPEPGYYQWGFVRDVLDMASPKLSALADLSAGAGVASDAVGVSVPGVLDASKYVAPPYGGSTTLTGRSWVGYAFETAAGGDFGVVVATGDGAVGKLEVWCDGALVGVVDAPPNGATAEVRTGALTAGSHGLLLRAAGGSVPVREIRVQ
jgi:hypothetical protein